MSERAAVAIAVAAWVGASLGGGPALWFGAVIALVALSARRPWILVLAAALLAATLDERARVGLDPSPRADVRGWVTLLTDPRPTIDGALVGDVRWGHRRLEAWARGSAAGGLRDRLAGERVLVRGTTRPPPSHADWLARRHVVGRLSLTAVDGWTPGHPVAAAANQVRRSLVHGAASLNPDELALYTGVVLGDDRMQDPVTTDDFRAAGLTHLLAVSGQNVAFVVALVGPVLRRLGLAGRMTATLAVIGLFAVVTRFEPSVLRASAMASLACVAAATGREASGLRLLALAVTALVLIDPFLVESVGFRLSVAASAGIILLAPAVARRIPGPRVVGELVAVTVAAQIAVAPLLVTAFGGVPVAALVANPLAAPVAGPLMAWGVAAGLIAGLAPPAVGAILHLPTRAMLAWLSVVAETCGRLPLGELGWPHLAALAAATAIGWTARRAAVRWLAATAVVAAVAALLTPSVGLRLRVPGSSPAPGATLSERNSAVVLDLDGGADAGMVLAGLRREGVRRVDVVVVRVRTRRSTASLEAIRERFAPALVVDGSRVPSTLGAAHARGPPLRHHDTCGRHGHPQPHSRLVLRPWVVL